MQSKNHVWPAISLSFIALVSGACGTASLTPDSGMDDVPIIQDAPSGEVLFFDDYSDPGSGWAVDDTYYFRGYNDGAYRIRIDQDETQYVSPVAVSGNSYGDVRIEVDVERVSGSDGAGIFLICRYQDNDNFYYAEIDGEGLLAVAAYFEDEEVILIDDFPTGVILDRNHLGLDCIGTEMVVYLDGVRLLSAAPLKIMQGDVGFGAGGSGRDVTDVRFDNFTVRSP